MSIHQQSQCDTDLENVLARVADPSLRDDVANVEQRRWRAADRSCMVLIRRASQQSRAYRGLAGRHFL